MKNIFLLLIIQLFICHFTIAKEIPKYERKYFKHWNDENRDCRNKRAEILKQRSLVEVTYRTSRRGECTVKTGKRNDYYFAEVQTMANQVDIDHIVPLKEAWISGAYDWSETEREIFANDSLNLAITYKKYNRQKGAQTPLSWAPIDRLYYCKYLADWIKIKKKYDLKINPKIYQFQKEAKCLEDSASKNITQ